MSGTSLKSIVRRIPLIGGVAACLYRKAGFGPRFPGSEVYWEDRYLSGGNSGDGSYGRLAEFKAGILNPFVRDNHIRSVIEYGVGDGNQLTLADYPSYIGFDVSETAVAHCRKRFAADATKTFLLVTEYDQQVAELTLSLDVVYHLVEDQVFEAYMHRLFDSATRFVIVYSSDSDQPATAQHVRHRKFTDWVRQEKPDWVLRRKIGNRYPSSDDSSGSSFADFYVYERVVGVIGGLRGPDY